MDLNFDNGIGGLYMLEVGAPLVRHGRHLVITNPHPRTAGGLSTLAHLARLAPLSCSCLAVVHLDDLSLEAFIKTILKPNFEPI